MLMTGWRRYYDQDDSAGGSDAAGGADEHDDASIGTEEGGDPTITSDGGEDAGSGDATGQAAEPQWGFREYLKQHGGIDLGSKYQTDEEAAKGLAHLAHAFGRRNEEAEIGRRFAPYQREFVEWLQSRQQPAAQQEQPKGWWEPPPVDESWNRWITRDANGNAALRDDTPVAVRDAIQKRQEYLDRWEHQLRTNPAEALKGAFSEWQQQTRQEVLDQVRQEYASYQNAQAANQFVTTNADWIYARTADGRVVTDINTGGPMFSPKGAVFTRMCVMLSQSGMGQDEVIREARQYADYWEAASRGQQPAAPAKPAGVRPHPGMSAGRQPAAGSVPGQPKNNPGTRGLSIREKMMQALSDVPEEDFATV